MKTLLALFTLLLNCYCYSQQTSIEFANKASVLYSDKNYSEAVRYCTRALDIYESGIDSLIGVHRLDRNEYILGLYLLRGMNKFNLYDYRGAIKDFNNVINLDSNNSTAYFIRGGAKIMLNEKDSGCLDLSRSGELGFTEAYERIKQDCK